MRRQFFAISAFFLTLLGIGTYLWEPIGFLLPPVFLVILIGLADIRQSKHAIRRNYPVVGHFRYLLEAIRPEVNQYFIESNTDGVPFSRDLRSVVYQRAKGALDTLPFGTQLNLYEPGVEWMLHSMVPSPMPKQMPRVLIGRDLCEKPYNASMLNISAMSYGALSKNAILALSSGAKQGNFAHNTGEGGISPYHLEGGGDLIWQIGTGYFGCRNLDGTFSEEAFQASAASDAVKMIEIKLSQGAKPAHGGILPARKVTIEISKIRGVPLGKDVLSPPGHSAFHTPRELLAFITKLRKLSGGKPIGIKLCVGKRREFLSLCKAMVETGEHPDYIAVDGAEGGTGAAPFEFSNSMGQPLTEGLIFVHNSLNGIGFRDRIMLIASGKVLTGFDMARLCALGADLCYSARAMMMAIGCIQARRCNDNKCPAGVATQDPNLVYGLDPVDKAKRVARYQHETLHSFMELICATGVPHPGLLRPWVIQRRTSHNEVRHYGQMYTYLEPGCLLRDEIPEMYKNAWKHASADSFYPVNTGPSMPAPPPSQRARN